MFLCWRPHVVTSTRYLSDATRSICTSGGYRPCSLRSTIGPQYWIFWPPTCFVWQKLLVVFTALPIVLTRLSSSIWGAHVRSPRTVRTVAKLWTVEHAGSQHCQMWVISPSLVSAVRDPVLLFVSNIMILARYSRLMIRGSADDPTRVCINSLTEYVLKAGTLF